MITFGITGGICSGKSTVTKIIREQYKIPIVDADIIIRQVVEPKSNGLNQLVNTFGNDILNVDGCLNRPYISNLVFNNKEAMDKLNSIMDPLVKKESSNQIQMLHNQGHYLVGYDYSLIIESGVHNLYRPLVVVSCHEGLQLSRLMARNNYSKEQALVRINSQIKLQDKESMANFIIYNNGGLAELASQIYSVMFQLKQL